jgi:ABC-2 type transport system ATP-binding protein
VIERFTARGGTVLLTTHYMEEAERLCHRIGIVDRGQIIALGTPAELIESTLGGQRLELELRSGVVTLEQLRALPGVSEATGSERRAVLTTQDVGQTLPALVRELEERGDRLVALSSRAATLEEAFVKLTGRALRDG